MARVALLRRLQQTVVSVSALQRHNAIGNISPFATSVRRSGYEDNIMNLKIGSHTKVLFKASLADRLHSMRRNALNMAQKSLAV